MKNHKERISLTENEETLLVPLYSKAIESQRPGSIFSDKKAEEILSRVEYDFSTLKIPRKTATMLFIRAKRLDHYAQEFLSMHPGGVIVHLGCGLDSRCIRVPHDQAEWFDLDLPEVIELRRKFYAETERYHMISSSVTDTGWIEGINVQGRPVLVVAEGLMMYLDGEQIKSLIQRIERTFDRCDLVFDAYSVLTARHASSHPSIKKTGASIRWGVDEPTEIERWGDRIHLQEEWYFTQSEDIHELSLGNRIMFSIAGWFKTANRAHRILYFRLPL